MEEAVGLHSVMKLPELLDLLHTYIDTNIEPSTLLAIGKDVLTNKSKEIETLRIPENGSFENKNYEGRGEVLETDLPQNEEAIKRFLEGE